MRISVRSHTPRPASYWPTAFALLGLLILDGALVWTGAFDAGSWRNVARLILVLDALVLGYWLLVHPIVRGWLRRPPA